jgi:DNA-binding transcriptional MerR regulator
MAPQGVASVKSPEAFRTISEVAEMLDVPQHVLRFWETRFTQIKPIKRAGGRRFYRPEDVDLLRGIRMLLYYEGYTIRGAQKILREKGARYAAALGREEAQNGHAFVAEADVIGPASGADGGDTVQAPREEYAGVQEAPAADQEDVKGGEPVAAMPAQATVAAGIAGAPRRKNPRLLRLEALRSELLELKSRIADARERG